LLQLFLVVQLYLADLLRSTRKQSLLQVNHSERFV